MALSTGSKGFLIVLVVAIVTVGATLLLLGGGGSAADDGQPVVVEIPEGTGAGEVADLLADRGVIGSALLFKIMARFDDRAGQIRPGTYELEPGSSTSEILEVLSSAPPEPPTFTVVIPEGLTVEQTLQRIADAEGSPFTVEQLREALAGVAIPSWVPVDAMPEGAEPFEGLLFPATYEFLVDADPQDVLSQMVAKTEEVMATITPPPDLDLYETLVMGSLIEREARLPEEQRVISAVMHNRLAAPMRLQIDATVLYALGGHKERVLYEDLEVDSPWNTYRVEGLPPTPISGAGRAAIEAAANPTDDDYLYYVVSDPQTGAHAFARTAEEHEANVAAARVAADDG